MNQGENMDISGFRIDKNKRIKLSDIDPDNTAGLHSKKEAKGRLKENIEKMADLQGKLYADDKYGILIIFQAMDTAGKDGAIKHVMSGLNPQGTQVHSFKMPSVEELDHDYLWRANQNLPERGNFGIFNRSYYEDVLVVKVHDLLKKKQIPQKFVTPEIWETRYRQIRDFERYLFENGYIILKFFLHISKEEQKKRLLSRIDDKSKNWKFSEGDIKERAYWNEYQKCYQEAISATSTKEAPWFIIPSNKKWFARLAISEIIVHALENLKLAYPEVSAQQLKNLESYKEILKKDD
jgi:PPK2 family polyphosphate:nucleotide phosphotransferase